MSLRNSSFLIGCLLIGLWGCGTLGNSSMLSTNSYPPVRASEFLFITTGDTDEPHEEIAIVSASGSAYVDTPPSELNERMKAEARKVGANAIIRVSYGSKGVGGIATATGTAIRVTRDTQEADTD